MTPARPPLSRLQQSRVTRLLLALVITIPLVASAVYMWLMWDPTETVDQMPVAVVNSDQAAGGVDAGAEVAQNLLDGQALKFRSATEEEADAGLRSGAYYFVIKIPRDFSKTLAGIGSTTAAPALIEVVYNDYNTLKASQIGDAAMAEISAAVLKGVSTTTVGTVLDGVKDLGDGLKAAADGSGRLRQGTGQLADGTDELTAGIVDKLAPGVGAAHRGSQQLAAGAGELSAGATKLLAGTDELGAGADELADGIERLTGLVDTASLAKTLDGVRSALPASARGELDQISELLDGLARLRSGSREIATQLTDPKAQYRGGLEQLAAGTRQLDSGAGELASGMGELNSGTAELADGARKLRDGAHELNDGAGELRNGLAKGVEQVPDLSDDRKKTTLAELVGTPVGSTTRHVAQAQFFGPGGAPAILIIASMLVAIVVLMSFRSHRFVLGDNRPRPLARLARRAALVSGIALAGMAFVGAVLWAVLDPNPDPASMTQVVILVIAATLMNVALVAALFTAFGYAIGALGSLAWLMLQLFSYGGVWMVETVPAPFQWLHWISPMTYVREGMIAAFNGAPGFGSALAAILVFGLLGAAVTFGLAAVARRRAAATGPEADDPTESLISA